MSTTALGLQRPSQRGISGASALTMLIVTLALTGLGVATYLSVVHFADQPIACNGLCDCEYVNSSEYAKVAGIPVAVLGAAAYASIAALAAGWWFSRAAALLLGAWVMTAASFAFSAYLTYIELEVLEAICVYCVLSASIVTLLFAATSALVWTQRSAMAGDEES